MQVAWEKLQKTKEYEAYISKQVELELAKQTEKLVAESYNNMRQDPEWRAKVEQEVQDRLAQDTARDGERRTWDNEAPTQRATNRAAHSPMTFAMVQSILEYTRHRPSVRIGERVRIMMEEVLAQGLRDVFGLEDDYVIFQREGDVPVSRQWISGCFHT